ncbi:hypothetical protein NITGR_530010 [Nitrospina gracilis 3/211]|uniref:4Fe-4S ferredoxin-type domain-containing protein n=1 Tax=Nitrospina gracilis (strain 3/211) TaxID=1266370 RepID=M1YZR5_NITG3|nr:MULTISPECIES: 4Fe-4S dicluster domain-containing protein [Nitrospina]MCF8723872.1 MauM/NapG family ferredoxin protein [Nitrospina sp. Nb-3]CCQ90992.1 hypothetical protein NITGR_530010 [Nitrospina gracilis 3/211]
MSLRYRLNKERFKGKKLPPKIRTNEDHVSEDQRGDLTSSDMEFEAVRRFKDAVKKPIEESEFSRRGLFSHLNRLKEYSDESERLEAEKNPAKKKKRKKKKKAKAEEGVEIGETGVAEATVDGETEEAVADATSEPASDTAVEEEPKPKKGFFRRVKEYFYPSLEFEQAKPKPKPKPEAAPKPAIAAERDSADGAPTAADAGDATAESAELEAHDASAEIPPEEDEERDPDDKEMDRRYMLRQSVHFFAKPTVDNIQGKIDKVNTAFDRITKRPPLLRPPGAISEREFLNACTRCSDCVNACPKDAILKVPKKMGFLIMDTPYIDPAKVPCVMCDGLPCIAACEEGALLPVPGGPRDVEMGYAILDKKKCQAYGDSFCQQCLIDCPIPGAITQDRESRPTIHKDVCTGCGVCVRSCGTVNIPVAIKVKPQMVIEYQQRKKEREKQKAELEARRQQLKAEQARQETATATEEPPEESGEDSTAPDEPRSEES